MKIFITSNVKKYFKTYIDFLDHYWINFFKKNRLDFILLNTDISNSLNKLKLYPNKKKLLILTGGSDVGKKKYDSIKRDNLEKKLIKLAIKKNIPILGICRGAQLFAKLNGIDLVRTKSHMRTKHYIKFNKRFLNYKKFVKVNSYHNYAIKKKEKKYFEFIAHDNNGYIELFTYKKNNIFMMWHPERNKNYSELKKIINFYEN